MAWHPEYPDMKKLIAEGEDVRRLLCERRAQRCTDCFYWDPIRMGKHGPTWGECRKYGFACKWTFGIGCDLFRIRPSRAFLKLVKG